MNPIIVALDNKTREEALELARELSGRVWGFKLNDLFVREGPHALDLVGSYGNIMLDLKLYDIPNTVGNICKAIASWGFSKLQIVTVHAHGGSAMMEAAAKELPGKIAAVTVLTSFDQKSYNDIHGLNHTTITISDQVALLAKRAQMSYCSYVVGSGQELPVIKGVLPPIIPGIRPLWHMQKDDQKRTMTPKEAIKAGAHLLVIGRPIIEASDPAAAADLTLKELGL